MVFCNITILSLLHTVESHNPYFNRWFSAIEKQGIGHISIKSHNPYFNRWFSAITMPNRDCMLLVLSQSLF